MDHQEEVRRIAYLLWEEAGHPEGCAEQHWSKAEAMWRERAAGEIATNGTTRPVRQSRGRKKKAGAEQS